MVVSAQEEAENQHEEFGLETDTEGDTQVGVREKLGVGTDIGFVDGFAEVVMSATETTVKDSCQCRLGITGIWTGMTPAEPGNKDRGIGDTCRKSQRRCHSPDVLVSAVGIAGNDGVQDGEYTGLDESIAMRTYGYGDKSHSRSLTIPNTDNTSETSKVWMKDISVLRRRVPLKMIC